MPNAICHIPHATRVTPHTTQSHNLPQRCPLSTGVCAPSWPNSAGRSSRNQLHAPCSCGAPTLQVVVPSLMCSFSRRLLCEIYDVGKAVSESYIGELHRRAASESYIGELYRRAASESCIRELHQSAASESCIRVLHRRRSEVALVSLQLQTAPHPPLHSLWSDHTRHAIAKVCRPSAQWRPTEIRSRGQLSPPHLTDAEVVVVVLEEDVVVNGEGGWRGCVQCGGEGLGMHAGNVPAGY